MALDRCLRQADHARITVGGAVSNDFARRQPAMPDGSAANQGDERVRALVYLRDSASVNETAQRISAVRICILKRLTM
jgi:hypothetical protein